MIAHNYALKSHAIIAGVMQNDYDNQFCIVFYYLSLFSGLTVAVKEMSWPVARLVRPANGIIFLVNAINDEITGISSLEFTGTK